MGIFTYRDQQKIWQDCSHHWSYPG